jgi:hypothetical protein
LDVSKRAPVVHRTTIRLDAACERYVTAVHDGGGSGSRLMRSLLLRHVLEVEAAEKEIRQHGYGAREILAMIRDGGCVDGEPWEPALRLVRAVEDGDEALIGRLLREA